ncbi:glutamine amidotransferase [Spirochaetia bacterium]|nr:glutamine amidotransferase [Spirochaetia bacterium]
MGKIIFTSQRVDIIKDYNERRDALDQKCARFLWETGCISFPVPNHANSANFLLHNYTPAGILLTGGNNPVPYNGDAPERDEVDSLLIQYAVSNKIPLAGVCRGMQSLVLYFGGTLKKVKGHIAVKHQINGEITREVNSYHSLSADSIPREFTVLAHSGDGEIESIRHNTLPITGIMWHPERDDPFSKLDIELFKSIFA